MEETLKAWAAGIRQSKSNTCDTCLHCQLDTAHSPYFCSENNEVPHDHIKCSLGYSIHPIRQCSLYKIRAKAEEEFREVLFTHSNVIDGLTRWLQGKLWWTGSISGYELLSAAPGAVPDVVAQNKADIRDLRAFEVKPKSIVYPWMEVARGIGQCILCSSEHSEHYKVESYLVAHEVYCDRLSKALSRVTNVGLVAYSAPELRLQFRVLLGTPL